MKKLFTLNNCIALLAIVCILLFLTPCYQIFIHPSETPSGFVNLFTATFGGPGIDGDPAYFVACAGLILGFVFLIVGLVLCIARNFCKWATLLAIPFFVTTGVLLCSSETLVRFANYNSGFGGGHTICIYGWPVAIGVVLFCLALFCLIDFISCMVKPKNKETY